MARIAASKLQHATSLKEVRPRLDALAEIAKPWLEPRALGLGAKVVADALAEPAAANKVRALSRAGLCNARCAEDLRASASAVLDLVARIDDQGPAPGAYAPARLRDEAQILKHAMIDVVDRALQGIDAARLWLEVVHLAVDDRDLVFDLRTLARLYDEHGDALLSTCDAPAEAEHARRCADAIEDELDSGRPESEWRGWLPRAWTVLVTDYDESFRVARFLSGARGDARFPSLAGIARSQRRRRMSAPLPTSGTWTRGARAGAPSLPAPSQHPDVALFATVPPLGAILSLPRSASLDPTERPANSVPSPAIVLVESTSPELRAAEPAPLERAVEPAPTSSQARNAPVLHAPAPPEQAVVDPAPANEPESLAPPVPSAGPPASDRGPGSSRGEERRNLELEVNLVSDSNFYVGFTENISSGGLFVATYMLRPIGSHVEIRLHIPGRSEPLELAGEVRWTREPGASADAWPGMGIRFESTSSEHDAVIRTFLAAREPLFFVE